MSRSCRGQKGHSCSSSRLLPCTYLSRKEECSGNPYGPILLLSCLSSLRLQLPGIPRLAHRFHSRRIRLCNLWLTSHSLNTPHEKWCLLQGKQMKRKTTCCSMGYKPSRN